MKHGLQSSVLTNKYNNDLMEHLQLLAKPKKFLMTTKTNAISDIFKSFKNSDGSTIIPKYILIEGAPGMGKTTLCKEIAYQWSTNSLLNETELLFMIYLHDPNIMNINSLKDLVHYQYDYVKENTELSEQCAKVLNDSDGIDLTIVFDGYDEYNSFSDSIITKILDRKVLPQCRIIVTSRLTASNWLHRLADVRVEVLGFTDESKIQYIRQELMDHPNKTNELLSYLNTHTAINSICYMPMMMTILVYTFKEKGYLPNNSTELYDKFIALTMCHHFQKHNISCEAFVTLQNFPIEYKSVLTDLSKFAFLTLQNKQKAFNKEDIKNLCLNSLLAGFNLEDFGIINSVKYFSIDKGDSHMFSFLHLSIHEYLAAYHLSSLDQCEQFKELETTFLNEMYQETWNMFIAINKDTWLNVQNYFIYCKGAYREILSQWISNIKSSFLEAFVELYDILNYNTMSQDSEVVQVLFYQSDQCSNNTTNHDTHQEQMYISLCDQNNVYRTKLQLFVITEHLKYLSWSKLFENLSNRFSVIFYKDHVLMLSKPNHEQVVDFFKFNISLTYIVLKHCHISKNTVDAIKSSCLQHLSHLEITSCTIEHNALTKLTICLISISTLLSITVQDSNEFAEWMNIVSYVIERNCNLRSLNLNSNRIQNKVAKKLTLAIKSSKHLEILRLHNSDLRSSGNIILNSLATTTTLTILHLDNNQIPQGADEALASVIMHNVGLKQLCLNDNNLGIGMLKVAKALQQITTLRILGLGNNKMPSKACDELALAIKSNKHLEQLGLSDNDLHYSAIVILNSLTTITTLTVLILYNNRITQEAGEALASVIMHNIGLETLNLNDNNLSIGALKVAKALQHITTLRMLYLRNNGLPQGACDELALAIKSNKELKELSLSGNDISYLLANSILHSLATITTLTALDLNNDKITQKASEVLASMIMQNRGLEVFYLNNNNLSAGTLKLAKAFQHISTLRMLSLDNSNIPKIACDDLALAIRSNKYLEKLWLGNNNLEYSAIVILNSLTTITTLTVLGLNNNQIPQEAGEALASVIMHNKRLEGLHLHSNNLGIGILKVAKALQHIITLKMLNLSNNNIPQEASEDLALAIKSNKQLEVLWLDNNNLQFSANIILNSLTTITTLTVLGLNNNQISQETDEALASVIMHNTRLEELYLDSNNLGIGTVKVVKYLQHITTRLRVLSLDNNNIPPEASEELALAIKSNEQLKKLWLIDNNLQFSANIILNSLATITTLTVLDLSNNQIPQEAGEALASVIMHNTGLEELHFDSNNLDIGTVKVAQALQHITTLKILNMDKNNIPQGACNELALAIKSNKHLKEIRLNDNLLHSSSNIILNSLTTIATLTVLGLNNNQITQEAGEALASVIMHNTRLEELYLNSNNLGIGTVKVGKALQHITTLKMLDLSNNNNIPQEACNELALAIKSNKHLKKLWLHSNSLHYSANVILDSLTTITTLTVLNLENNQLTQQAGEILASVIMHNTGLEDLCLNNDHLGVGALKVSEALQHITTLRILGLSNNEIPQEACDNLTLAIKSNKHLKQLWLNDNNLYSSANIILNSLTTITTLTVLNLDNNQITQEAGETLASIIMYNTGLEMLCLNSNNLRLGILKVAKALQHITTLRALSLGNNNIPQEACGELALAIKSNKRLKWLWLNDNNLQNSSICILKTLSSFSTLKVLNMQGNEIGRKCGKVLESVINSNSSLTELYLNGNNLQKSAIGILEALQNISTLELLDLGNNSLTKDIEGVLANVIQSNNSFKHLSLHNNNLQSSVTINILQTLQTISNLNTLNIYGNTITEETGNVLASVITKNTELQRLELNLLISPLQVIKALQNLSALQLLVFCTCNISEQDEIKITSVITNNKSLTWLLLSNIRFSQHIILQAMAKISNLTTLWLEDNLLSKQMTADLSLAISTNKSLEILILLDNMLQTGLIEVVKACNKLCNIKVLQLAHNCIVPCKIVELTSIITQSTSLGRVLLGGITLNAAECFHFNINEVLHKIHQIDISSYLISSNNHCKSLEVIYLEMLRKQIDNSRKCLSNVSIDINAKNFSFVEKIYQYFERKSITQFKIQEIKRKLAQVDAKRMISSLYILEKVKVIDLENNNVDEDASLELATALHSNNVLEQLWLRGNKLNTAGALYILNSLEYLTTLQVLDLSYNNFGSESADGIAAVIDNNPLMNQLWLDGNDLYSTGTIIICNALKKIRTLSILSLCNNGITDDAADELSAVITHNVLLEDLLLSNNQLQYTGITIIAESLSKLIKLRKLDLFNNDIRRQGASSLAVVLQNSTSLQDLFLSGNNLETSGALEICNALNHINSLHVLTLSNNNISDEVTSELIEILNNNHLYALLIGGNGLECGALTIAQVIENDNIAMQLLDFSNNNISEQDKEKIKVVFSKRANFQFYI